MSGRNLSWFDWRIALVLIVIAGSFAAVLAFPEWVPLRYIWAAAVATAAFASPRATLVVGIFATFAAVLGTLLVGNARAPLFWVDIIGYLLLVALSYVIAVRRSRSEELLRTQATTDALTGLANRRLLVDRLQAQLQVRGADQSSAVIYADLDDFKTVNDNFGHTIGDEVLIRASERLLGCVQEADTIARFGGDEFVIAVPNMHDKSDVDVLCHRIIDAFARPFEIHGMRINTSISLGAAITRRGRSFDVDELIDSADRALRECKAQCRGAARVQEIS